MTGPDMIDTDRDVTVERLGGLGDGIAEVDGRDVFIPGALPSEHWRLRQGQPPQRLSDSPDRVPPPCIHFDRCGGCTMQHVKAEAYVDWKRGLVVDALARHGIDTDVAPLRTVPAAARRRAVLAARSGPGEGTGDGVVGFHMARDHTVVDIPGCTILRPEIIAALPGLRTLAVMLGRDTTERRFVVLASATGLDVGVDGAGTKLRPQARSALARLAQDAGWARLTVGAEEIVSSAAPELVFAGARVVPPPGTFVQAVAEAEAHIQDCVVAALARAKTVADLFAGVGTLTFPIARKARVLAIDSDREALDALAQAQRHAQGFKPIETLQRDLHREPLARKELEPFDCVVFDPPRAGAKAQAEMLARSQVPAVVAVSCNPATLVRDLAIMVDGGYTLESVTPIDQFVYTAHVEVVAVLRRPAIRNQARRR